VAWSSHKLSGALLAAVLAEDRHLDLVAAHMDETLAGQISSFAHTMLVPSARQATPAGMHDSDMAPEQGKARQRARWTRAERKRALSTLLSRVTGDLPVAPALPARALALLAPRAPRAVGRRWQAGAPLPAAGFLPDPELLDMLEGLARRCATARPVARRDDEGSTDG